MTPIDVGFAACKRQISSSAFIDELPLQLNNNIEEIL